MLAGKITSLRPKIDYNLSIWYTTYYIHGVCMYSGIGSRPPREFEESLATQVKSLIV